ncbi:MAG: hypothetical protein K8F91_20605, partial [Candidatus Obscuribacterales bacterium]|nr:hypothetical protein [Candidatus Obscuribacterales bacterium]
SGEAPLSKYIDIVSESNRYYFRIGDSSLPEVKGEVVLDFCSDTVSPKWRFIVAEDKGNLITNSTFYMSDGKPIRSYEVEPFQKDNIWLPQHWTRIDYDASSGETNRLVASELLEFEIISDPDAHEFQWDSIPFPDGTKVMTFTKSGQWTTKLRAGEELVPMQVYFEAQELLRDSREQKGE